MEKKLKEIVEQANLIAEREVIIKEAFQSVIEEINNKIRGLNADIDLQYVIRAWFYETYENSSETLGRNLSIKLYSVASTNQKKFSLNLGKETSAGFWEDEELISPSISNIKRFVEKLPDALNAFAAEIDAKNLGSNEIYAALNKTAEMLR